MPISQWDLQQYTSTYISVNRACCMEFTSAGRPNRLRPAVNGPIRLGCHPKWTAPNRVVELNIESLAIKVLQSPLQIDGCSRRCSRKARTLPPRSAFAATSAVTAYPNLGQPPPNIRRWNSSPWAGYQKGLAHDCSGFVYEYMPLPLTSAAIILSTVCCV